VHDLQGLQSAKPRERPDAVGGATPVVSVVALEQMGFSVDPVTGRLVKGLMLIQRTGVQPRTSLPWGVGSRSGI